METIPSPSPADIGHAAALLAAGELVAFPTETVYGLGGDAQNPSAIARIYAAKGRPSNHPVIVHLAGEADPARWASAWPDAATRLAQAFWPGPLTMIVARALDIPDAVSGGQATIGLRCPAHPVAQALLRAFRNGQGGIAAPSANRFGQVSPTTARHVWDEFGDAIYVIDGGTCPVGIESTIIDLSRGFPALLRPGQVTPAQLAEVLGEPVRMSDGSERGAPRTSGTLRAHYAPRTPLSLGSVDDIALQAASLAHAGATCAVVGGPALRQRTAGLKGVAFRPAPAGPQAWAQALYGLLRDLDRSGADRILIERLPDAPEWVAVNDRLGRAAAAFLED
jgi:L-threonylcarbamoyladenylate synthase